MFLKILILLFSHVPCYINVSPCCAFISVAQDHQLEMVLYILSKMRAAIAFPSLHSLSLLNKAFHLQMTQGGAAHPFNCVVLIPVKSTHFSNVFLDKYMFL